MKTYSSLSLAKRYPNMRPKTRSQLLAACWYVWDLPVNDMWKASHRVQVLFGGGIITPTVNRYDSLTFREWEERLRKAYESIVRQFPERYKGLDRKRNSNLQLLLEEASCRN